MRKQKIFKTFKCIYVPDCFVVNRFIFLETSPESSGVKSAYDPEVQNLEKLQGELPPAINVEITQAIKDFKDAKRLVETYTKQLKDLQSGHDDYAIKARIRTTKQYLEDSKNKLQDAEKKLDEVIDKHSESIKVAETAAKLMRKEERRLKIAELYKAEEAARLAAIPLPTAASGAAAATGKPTAKPTTAPKAAPAQAPASSAAPEPAPAAAPAAAPDAKKPPEKPADWTPEQKFQRMMDRYVGDGFLISKDDFAKALNYAKGTPTVSVFTATNVSEIKNAATIVKGVKLLQEKLNSEKSAGLEVDGIFGRKTNAAYKSPAPAPAEAPAAARPAAEPERKPAAPAETVPAPAPLPEAKAETPAEKITFDTTRFYEVNEDINNLATDKRYGLKAYNVVYLPPGEEIQPDKSVTVKTSNNKEITFQKDYLTHLGGKDWGVKQKEKFMADFYEKEAGVDRNKLHFINSTTAQLGGTVSSITNRVVEVTQSNAGVGLSKVKLETGAEINVKTADLEKVTDEAKINRYIIDRYQNRIS